jgi:hypothetical protein
MPFDWREFLKLARALKAQADAGTLGPVEAVYRTVVGRAYYAAFGYAHEFAVNWLNFIPRHKAEERSQDHGRLRALLRDRRRRAAAERLNRLRDWRNECDYIADLPDVRFAERVENALSSAQYVIDALPVPRTA